MKYKLKELRPKVFCVTVKNQFDLSLLFWRYQEYYECGSKKFKGKQFTLLEYMKWYCKKHGDGSFSYPDDYIGFNVPSYVIRDVLWGHVDNNPDYNEYDDVMQKIDDELLERTKNEEYYLIGVTGKDKKVVAHEVSHGLYFTNESFRTEMNGVLRTIPEKKYKKFKKVLKGLGYAKSVHDDEIIAYCSTGLHPSMKKINIPGKTIKKFKEVYKTYTT